MKPSTVKGTRDFDAVALEKRYYVISILQKHFKRFGFEALETPAFENLETLTGKYGEEGDRLIFKILNSGLNQSQKKEEISAAFSEMLEKPITSKEVCNKALRYDLTVPFARYVAMNHGQMAMPFKRYQIQPVWRADRPQKGRFREFYQCDADVVGSESLLLDVEMILLYNEVFQSLDIPVKIHYNNRKILEGIAAYAGIDSQLIDFTVALDKLDKIGKDKVIEELLTKGIGQESIEKLTPLFENYSTIEEKWKALEPILSKSEIGKQGLVEAQEICNKALAVGIDSDRLELDITLARGLDYYTGSIYEVKAQGVDMGSIGGGGRYDKLTEVFGVNNMPGIGISFGLDRIILVMESLEKFGQTHPNQQSVLVLNLSEDDEVAAEKLVLKMRQSGISCELYPETAKLKKQFQYAERKGIGFVAFYGEKEREENIVTIKNIESSIQKMIAVEAFLKEGKSVLLKI